jgi:tetratricopeptide (TPR) repeat protein
MSINKTGLLYLTRHYYFYFKAFLCFRGAYSDALSHFHAAVDADPNNYMSYYKRATVYMALSRSRPALADLDKILELKPDFLKVVRSWAVFSYLPYLSTCVTAFPIKINLDPHSMCPWHPYPVILVNTEL